MLNSHPPSFKLNNKIESAITLSEMKQNCFRTADQAKLQVDGYSSTNCPKRISLGGISNPFRDEKVRQCQKNIREGIENHFTNKIHMPTIADCKKPIFGD